MPETVRCPHCGAALGPAATDAGQCPACLLKLTLEPAAVGDGMSTSAMTQTAGGFATPHLRFAPDRPLPNAGETFGPYRLHRVLGRGGFGVVCEAEHLETHRRVALKMITAVRASSRDAVERFEREGRLAASVNHPRCVFIFGAEQIDGYPTISMELMPGGTLQDAIDSRGRIPWRHAVDWILDVVEGLDAAQRAGVIHRDIKPSNCFVDDAGRVSIGDFGISRTLDEATELTQPGGFIGTPAYAAPEQVRGRDVDFRADMYAVGATLYALLAGRPPFTGGTGADALARVLTERPAPLAGHGATVPRGLELIIQRLLAKEPAARFRDYPALMAVLQPFSTAGMSTATLAQRFAAYIVDTLAVGIPVTVLRLSLGDPASPWVRLIGLTVSPLFWYYLLTEWPFGRSPGKWLFGLRVVTLNGERPPFWRIAVRSALFVGPALTLRQLRALTALDPIRRLLSIVGQLIPLWTMRPANGYAGLHDLLSGTRVVATRVVAAVRVPTQPIGSPLSGTAQRFGPYLPQSTIWRRDGEALLMARDDLLKRDVWVHTFDRLETAVPIDAFVTARPGRLRWLAGVRSGTGGWDAYEAPSGSLFGAWVAHKGRLTWGEARGVLTQAAAELSARASEPRASSLSLSLDHIWIRGEGRAIVLDIPAAVSDEPVFAVDEAPALLRRLTRVALEGADAPMVDLEPPRVPMPRHAREFIDNLWGAHLMPSVTRPRVETHAIAGWHRELTTLADRPADVARTSRGAAVLALALLLLPIVTAATTVVSSTVGRGMPVPLADWSRYAPGWYTHEEGQAGLDEPHRTHLDAYRMVVSDVHARIVAEGLEGRFYVDERVKQWLSAARERYPAPGPDVIRDARRILEAEVSGTAVRASNGSGARQPFYQRPVLSWPISLLVIVYAVPALLCAVTFRGPLLLKLFGIALQDRRGVSAGRLRSLVRATVAWAPALVLAVLTSGSLEPARLEGYALAFVVIYGVASVYAVLSPQRGIPDLVAGTHLVPK